MTTQSEENNDSKSECHDDTEWISGGHHQFLSGIRTFFFTAGAGSALPRAFFFGYCSFFRISASNLVPLLFNSHPTSNILFNAV